MLKKHAYLILCHDHFHQLGTLLKVLDDPRNDIYLHVDQKSGDFSKQLSAEPLQASRLYDVDRISVTWGGYSLVRAEMNLLNAAVQNETPYAYYHLISGVDLPIKSQEEIHGFFAQNEGREFIAFSTKANQTRDFLDRISLYHFFQEEIGRKKGLLSGMEQLLLGMQLLLSVDRLGDKRELFYKGPNWFSITDNLARFVVAPEQQAFIEKYMKYSLCADEIFLQTIAMNSPYRDAIVNNSMRLIDWKRGNPYIFTAADYDLLTASNCLFARKFDEDTDSEIIDKIVCHITAANEFNQTESLH